MKKGGVREKIGDSNKESVWRLRRSVSELV